MQESQLGFEYTWADLKPVRALSVVISVGQVLGAAAAILFHVLPRWFESLWFGAAAGSFAGFIVGVLLQHHLRPGSIRENAVMVRRIGLITAFLTVIAIAILYRGVPA
jgi:hypothetical protein